MLLELAERLRCPNAHAPTPLIVVAREKRDRALIRGDVGCPVCHLEARFRDGHLDFGAVASPDASAPAAAADAAEPDLDRVIALLGIGDPDGAVLLTGRYAALAAALRDATGVTVVVLHAADVPPPSEAVSAVLGAVRSIPFTDATFRGAAIDASLPAALAEDAVRAVAIRGRLLGAASVPVPHGVRELARDADEWVGEREAGGAVVQLGRRGKSEEQAGSPKRDGER